MLIFNRQIDWRGIGTTAMVESLTLLALVLAVVTYVDWSSNRAVAEFTNTTRSSASGSNRSSDSSAQMQPYAGRTGCPRGNKSLPTQLAPLP
ncbi:hypothetical protein [Bradyrhizobium sp.]|uniref:hypothetical protein n=1 Tax=Bradyrhizobium sp. TaxID=376 RepID=UPI002D12CC81|nr:hypothetical protein [Bradyrhizobium sp.]HMM89607.1 hypothetical protein [Bradyrhizobium sp.]